MAATEKRRRNKVSIGLAANRPALNNSGLSFGDEYFATNTGEYSKCTSTAAGVKQWTVTAIGQGLQFGTDTLAGGSKVITAAIATTSRILVSRRAPPGGGTAIGLLTVSAPAAGVAAATFTVDAIAEANQAVVAADTSVVDWLVVA